MNRRSGLLVPDAPDDAQQTLPLAASVRVATNVRLFRGVLRWDTKEGAEAHVARCGNIFRVSHRMVQARPRQTRIGWTLCAWDGGFPHLLDSEGEMRRVRAVDL